MLNQVFPLRFWRSAIESEYRSSGPHSSSKPYRLEKDLSQFLMVGRVGKRGGHQKGGCPLSDTSQPSISMSTNPQSFSSCSGLPMTKHKVRQRHPHCILESPSNESSVARQGKTLAIFAFQCSTTKLFVGFNT